MYVYIHVCIEKWVLLNVGIRVRVSIWEKLEGPVNDGFDAISGPSCWMDDMWRVWEIKKFSNLS
jgi:hypothetical protein